MAKRISVIVSQGQSANPSKRALEEDLVTALIMEPGIDVAVVPHLYDLKPDGTGVLALQGVGGDMIVLSWLYERATRWTLDRVGVRGQEGVTLLKPEDDDEDDDVLDEEAEDKHRVIDQRDLPKRKIYCIDLRVADQVQPYLDEIKRIASEAQTQVVGLTGWLGGSPGGDAMQRFLKPTNDTALGATPDSAPAANGNGNGKGNGSVDGNGHASPADSSPSTEEAPREPLRVEETGGRRWYPVIDYSRCTNCMECIDFCLFGVYGVDGVETILVEQPDNCRKGCPACSRVCPENAIIFPQHKTPAIAGSADAASGLKIDLSKLFGAPESNESAAEVAARERDEQLLAAGRDAVGMTVGIPQPKEHRAGDEEKDELDDLIDELDELDL
ncbi:MAG: ferredoxin family protein [Pirellulaceae bacterium]